MVRVLDNISQVSICLQEAQERVHEVALLHPLANTSSFDTNSKPVQQRVWNYLSPLSWTRRFQVKVHAFLFRSLPFFIPAARVTPEAKFKTVLALVLAQEELRDFFLSQEPRRRQFFEVIQRMALDRGYEVAPPEGSDPLEISRAWTILPGQRESLLDDLVELNLQKAALPHETRQEILCTLLSQVERPPLTSLLELTEGEEVERLFLTTHYATYAIASLDLASGRVDYLYKKDRVVSGIQTGREKRAEGGVINQHTVVDPSRGEWIGSYSGLLDTRTKVLEEILCMLDVQQQEVLLVDKGEATEERKLLFTSLFSWNEMGRIGGEHLAIQGLDNKLLKIGKERVVRLQLLHLNVPLNALTHYPVPGETGAVLRDNNDEAMLVLMAELWNHLGWVSETLQRGAQRYKESMREKNIFRRHQTLLHLVDLFREHKEELIAQLELNSSPLAHAALALLKGKKISGKRLQGIDFLLYLNVVAQELGYRHNKNCEHALDRAAAANAADKAQYAYKILYGETFLPDYALHKETELFKVLYSMYLVWEEPERNAGLSTGFIGEKFHHFFRNNPEATKYLVRSVKKHPELYLGLSEERS